MIPVLSNTTRKELDEIPLEDVRAAYGEPEVRTRHVNGIGYWKPGDGTPDVVAESPAVAQAMGRCIAVRTRFGGGLMQSESIHPATCDWCEFDTAILLAACDHATWISRLVDFEIAVWRDPSGREYVRSTNRGGEYDNPAWATFFLGATPATSHGLSPTDQTFYRMVRLREIAAAAGHAATG